MGPKVPQEVEEPLGADAHLFCGPLEAVLRGGGVRPCPVIERDSRRGGRVTSETSPMPRGSGSRGPSSLPTSGSSSGTRTCPRPCSTKLGLDPEQQKGDDHVAQLPHTVRRRHPSCGLPHRSLLPGDLWDGPFPSPPPQGEGDRVDLRADWGRSWRQNIG